MERVALLLQELIVQRLVLRLLGLLFHRTGGKLRLTTLQGSLLRASAKTGKPLADTSTDAIKPLPKRLLNLGRRSALAEKLIGQRGLLLAGAGPHAVNLLPQGSLLLRGCRALAIELLAQRSLLLRRRRTLPQKLLGQGSALLGRPSPHAIHLLPQGSLLLRRCRALAVKLLRQSRLLLRCRRALPHELLSQSSLLLRCRNALAEALLADAEELLGSLLLRLPVGLFSLQGHALLLLGCAKRLPIALLIDVPQRLRGGEVLLLGQIGLGNAPAITTEGASADLIANNFLLLLLLLLPQSLESGLRHSLSVGRHIGRDIQPAGRDLPRASKAKSCRKPLVWLRASLGACNVLGSRRLEWRSRRLPSIKALQGSAGKALRLTGTSSKGLLGSTQVWLRSSLGLRDVFSSRALKRRRRCLTTIKALQGSARKRLGLSSATGKRLLRRPEVGRSAALGAGNVLGRRSLQRRCRCLTTIEALCGRLIIGLRLGRAAKQSSTGSLIIGLRGASGLADIGNASLLRLGKRSDKLAAIRGKALLGNILRASIYRVIPGQNLWRYRYRGSACAALTAAAHDASFQPPVWA